MLMVFSSPMSASTNNSTLENHTGASEHQVSFFETSKSNLTAKGKISLVEEEKQPATTAQSNQDKKQQQSKQVDKDNIQQASQESENEAFYVTATAYTAFCDGCSGTTYTGQDLRSNPDQKVIAVDPNVIPLGSRVWVEGYGVAIAGDIGGAIKGKRIDIFIPKEADALRYGVRQVRVKILD
ncbi:hypothetical protein E3U55_07770 [Filobacillus milosensis]|uniref:3D domain-containing protein n=2 Tax=Filobacillus milosensis TaxID=94137 RepID=A0A4Y8IL45_9BACI|nr:hypothetical protein E3U55_07770 [Filobacillus milosensis]